MGAKTGIAWTAAPETGEGRESCATAPRTVPPAGVSGLSRRAFVFTETMRLGRFLDVSDLVGWRRSYRCDCGFHCTGSGEIHDHATRCRVQQEMFA